MNFYSYSPTFGMEYHKTGAEAKAAAVLALSSPATCQKTEESVTSITWGEVTERATPTGDVGYALKRQDRLTYELAHPQVVNGRMENANGDMIQVKNIKEKDLLEHDMVLSVACIWLPLSAMLARFKLHTMEDITTFVELLFDSYGVKRGGSEGNMQFTTYDKKYKLIVGIQKTIDFGPEIEVAKQKMMEAVEIYPEEANDLKTMLTASYTQIDGKLRVAEILRLRTFKFNNPLWHEGMKIIDDSIEVAFSKKQIRLYMRHNPGEEYAAVPLHIAAL
ncbi:MAG: DUF3164 family protein [Desulfuromonadaceae bacterium]